MSAFMSQSQLNNASSLIGKQVTALTSDGDSLTGVVTRAQMNGSDVLLEIDGKFVSLANVTKVEAATAVSDQIDALADLLVDALFGDVDGSELETSAI
jgi:alkyl hydroperoxide reductase subunit AhpF